MNSAEDDTTGVRLPARPLQRRAGRAVFRQDSAKWHHPQRRCRVLRDKSSPLGTTKSGDEVGNNSSGTEPRLSPSCARNIVCFGGSPPRTLLSAPAIDRITPLRSCPEESGVSFGVNSKWRRLERGRWEVQAPGATSAIDN